MKRLTTRIEDKVYYSKGKYSPTTLIAEMETDGIRECINKLAEYEDIGIEPERLKEFLGNFGISIVMKNTKLMNELQEGKEIISKMAKRLKVFEDNTFNMGWIPISERLPEGTERVIVTLQNEMVLEVFFISGEFKFHEVLPSGGMKKVCPDNPVVAWQPLPEPYKEE